MTTVRLFVGGPGLYFDFSAFMVHVPDNWSAPAVATNSVIAVSSIIVAKPTNFLFSILPSSARFQAGPFVLLMFSIAQNVQHFLGIRRHWSAFTDGQYTFLDGTAGITRLNVRFVR